MQDTRPPKPYLDFPLFPNQNGQWAKKIKGKPYYFGKWSDDPRGNRALAEFKARHAGILTGTDSLRAAEASYLRGTLGVVVGAYLRARRLDMEAGSLARATYVDLVTELMRLVNFFGDKTMVEGMGPGDFARFVEHVVIIRKCKAHSRKRILQTIKGMFRWANLNDHIPALPKFGSSFDAPCTTPEAIRQEKLRAGVIDYGDRILTGAEIDLLVENAPTPNFAAMILLGVNCGLGPAELARLKWRNMADAWLDYPRQKTGNNRKGYLWKRTREALERLKTLKHTQAAFRHLGSEALVFRTRRNQPYYREQIVQTADGPKLKRCNAISVTIGRMISKLKKEGHKLEGVSAYRLRHTFKTLGKKARDRDALHLCMGHKANTVEEGYDHEVISPKRIKRVALKVKKALWPLAAEQVGVEPLLDLAEAQADD